MKDLVSMYVKACIVVKIGFKLVAFSNLGEADFASSLEIKIRLSHFTMLWGLSAPERVNGDYYEYSLFTLVFKISHLGNAF